MTRHSVLVFIAVIIAVAAGTALFFPEVFATRYENTPSAETPVSTVSSVALAPEPLPEPFVRSVTHIETPEHVKAIYMSSWVAATPSRRAQLIEFMRATEINAVVLDIKDATGRVSFLVDDPLVAGTGAPENRIRDIDALITELHNNNIYIIGRISVFQDPYLAIRYPDWAIRRSNDGDVWKDRKGLSFLSPTSRDVWEYTVALARASYERGFDEINFDYMRFPSDGDISNIAYPNESGKTRADFLEDFFVYLHQEMTASAIPTSIDLFGMVTTAQDDLGIGQVLERALPYFDYIAPMVYPSHYPPNFIGLARPSSDTYKVVHHAMQAGIQRAQVLAYGPEKFRTWIQDFNLGGTYTAEMVRAQIQASEDLGITSWMVWDPGNSYTTAAYLPNE